MARFLADAVELEAHPGDADERVVTALGQVRAELGRASEMAQLLQLASIFDEARQAATAADVLARLRLAEPLERLIDQLGEIDELISHRLGTAAVASLLIAPQREIRVDGGVAQAGVFVRRGSEDRCAVVLRWHVERQGFTTVALSSFDEVDLARGDPEHLLTELAYAGRLSALEPRARAAIVIGPARLGNVDLDEASRWLTSVGVVHEVGVELIAVPNPRDLSELDQAIAERGYDLLCLWVNDETDPGWAWSRGKRYADEGGQLRGLFADDVDSAVAEMHRQLADLFGGGEDEEDDGSDIPSVLQAAGQEDVRAQARERAIKVVFVGGNERQERHRAAIEAALSARYGTVEVIWFGGWGKNWNATLRRARDELEDEQVLVLMPYTATLLGRGLRKAAPSWIACTGRGRQAMQQAIELALAEVVRRRIEQR
jgi:hypothetical protein